LNVDAELKKIHRVAFYVWGAMLGSIFIYAAVIEFLSRSPEGSAILPGNENSETIKYVFIGLAIASYLVIPVIKRAYGLVSGAKYPFSAAITKLYTGSMIIFAVCEVPAVLGVALYFLAGSRVDFYMFLAISILMFIIYFPRVEQWREMIE